MEPDEPTTTLVPRWLAALVLALLLGAASYSACRFIAAPEEVSAPQEPAQVPRSGSPAFS